MSAPWLIPAGGVPAAAQYQIARSLRFRSVVPEYLTRTPSVRGDLRKWTWAGWVKRSQLGALHCIFSVWGANNDANYFSLYFNTTDQLVFQNWTTNFRISNAVYRDPSAWMFILAAMDAANTTCRIEVNGVAVTSWATINPIINQDYAISSLNRHNIGRREGSTVDGWIEGYMADCYFIDGQYLDSTSFGQVDAITGAWVAKAYAGTYGTTGFHLDFADNSNTTAATLGKDSSPNANNWTPNNFSVTAGITNDSLTDTPSNYGSDTGVGGEVRGNYCTLNPLTRLGGTLSNGNLLFIGPSAWYTCLSTIALPTSGKFKFEAKVTAAPYAPRSATSSFGWIGIAPAAAFNLGAPSGSSIGTAFGGGGYYCNFSGSVDAGVTVSLNDVITCEIDTTANTFRFFVNGVSRANGTINSSGPYVFAISSYDGSYDRFEANFGQRPWEYQTTAGFKALCTQNMAALTPALPGTFTGNANADGPFVWAGGVVNTVTINGNVGTRGTHFDGNANGIKLRTASASYNTSGSNTVTAATYGASIKYSRAQSNP